MRIRHLAPPLIVILLLSCLSAACSAIGLYTVSLRATRQILLADGKQTTDILADVRDSNGRPVGNNVTVQFQTTSGTLSQSAVQTFAGTARARLTSSPIAGTAHVTALVAGSSAVLDLLFTDDPQATFEGNLYVQVTANSYLAYSATDRIIEAQGKDGGAKLTFRNIELTADRLQLRCDDNIVRAHNNITLKRGNKVFKATRLYYSLQTGQGYAVAELNSRLQTVVLSGENLNVVKSPTPIPTSYITFQDIQVKLVVVARSITYFPNDRLQFRRPKFYQDQKQIMSLAYYELPLNSNELFSDQFFSVGTSGLGLELPIYYNMTPSSSGIFYLRHQQQLGRSYYATEPGWSIDVLQSYSSQGNHRVEGAYGFTGLTRDDWDFRWSHNQEFNPNTQGSFYLDFPQHDSIFSTANLSQQSRFFRWGASLAAGQAFTGLADSTMQGNLYLETQPHRLGPSKDLLYTIGTTLNTSDINSADTSIGRFSQVTEGINMRAFTHPINIDRRTTLTNSLTVGQLWGTAGSSGMMTLMTVSLDHTLPGGGAVNFAYDFVAQPSGFDPISGKHRLSVTYTLPGTKRFQALVFGSAFLDAADASLIGDLIYRLDKRWRLMTALTLQRFGDLSYRDIEFTIGRQIGARELQLTYSTLNNRLSFDLTATRF